MALKVRHYGASWYYMKDLPFKMLGIMNNLFPLVQLSQRNPLNYYNVITFQYYCQISKLLYRSSNVDSKMLIS